MYPGRSIWARGVLALGAGTLLLSGLQWWSESTRGARSIRVDDPSISERSEGGANYYVSRDVDGIFLGSRRIEDDRKRSARSSDRRRSLDRDIPRNAENEEGIFTAFSRLSIIPADGSVKRDKPDKIEENSRLSPEGRASILESSEGDEGSTRRTFAAGMQEDRLLFFRENRERAESSAKAIRDRKDLTEERDSARRRRETSRDWFTRTWNRSQNFREGNLRESDVEGIENNDENDVHETDLSINEEGGSRDALSEDLNTNVDSEFRDEIDDEESSSANTSAFQILDSVIPPDNKRGKVTRGEDSKDLMVASNFVLTSQDRRIDPGALVSEYRPIFARNKRKTKKMIRSIVLRKEGVVFRGRSDNARSIAMIRKADRRETMMGDDRRKRHANYYSAQSATPMAYVHIQPAHPAAPPPTSRKCVRCMVVYKPCASQPRPPPRIVLPSYRYHEPASNWRGLKYGE